MKTKTKKSRQKKTYRSAWKDLPALLLCASVLVLDIFSKILVHKTLAVGKTIPLLPFFSLTHIQNTGAAFGILKDTASVLSIVSVIVLGFVLYFYLREDATHIRYSLAVFAGGILGNLVERVLRGSVTDFIAIPYWPAFNVADTAITLSVVALCYFVFVKKEE